MAARPPGRGLWAALAALAVIVVIGLAVLVWALHAPTPKLSPEIASRTPDVEHGRYLAVLGDCAGCHTRPGGAPFAGGAALRTPMGFVFPPNITPDATHGAGTYSLPEWMRMMRQGVAKDGRRLYPAMPYPSYAKVSDADLQDLWAFFQKGVAPSTQPRRASAILWPLSIRWPVAFWNKAFLDGAPFRPDPAHDVAWNRGAYLVQGLGHCGACHTPRGVGYQELATNERGGPRFLNGAELDGQTASNLRGDPATGLGRWSPEEIVELLKTARTAHAAVAGQMTEVVANSTQYVNDGDLQAVASYLKSLPPAGETSTFQPDGATIAAYHAGQVSGRGMQIYMDSCSACHRLDGAGQDRTLPPLAGNPSVLNENPASLITVVLGGARLPSTAGQPSRTAMPGYAWRYSDADIAAVTTFLRSAWGNHAPAVTAGQVKRLRHLAEQKARRG